MSSDNNKNNTLKIMPVQSRSSSKIASSSRGGGNLYLPHSATEESHLSTLTPQQYLQRMLDFHQMDLQSAVDQMRTLLSFYPQRVYKMAYYRKQTKNHWVSISATSIFISLIVCLHIIVLKHV
jgi:hypothetical protein